MNVLVSVMVAVGEEVRVAVGGIGDEVGVGGRRVGVGGSMTGPATVPRSQASKNKGSIKSSLHGMEGLDWDFLMEPVE